MSFATDTLLAPSAKIEQKLSMGMPMQVLLIEGLEMPINSQFRDGPFTAAEVKPFQQNWPDRTSA